MKVRSSITGEALILVYTAFPEAISNGLANYEEGEC
jgi:hypothetical protein